MTVSQGWVWTRFVNPRFIQQAGGSIGADVLVSARQCDLSVWRRPSHLCPTNRAFTEEFNHQRRGLLRSARCRK